MLESAYRIPQSEAKLPRIPVQPIGYDEAEILLKYDLVINSVLETLFLIDLNSRLVLLRKITKPPLIGKVH